MNWAANMRKLELGWYISRMSESKSTKASFWMALAAMVVSVVALGVSIYEAQLMRDQSQIMQAQQKAGVWPFIKKITTIDRDDQAVHIRCAIINKGVGPALIKKTDLVIDSFTLTDYSIAVDLINETIGFDQILSFSINPSFEGILSPGEAVTLYEIKTLPSSLESGSLVPNITLCYCSIYDDCWTQSSDSADPVASKTCL